MTTKQKKVSRISLAFLITLCLACYIGSVEEKYPLGFDVKQIENFDVVLTKGESVLSRVVRLFNPSPASFSHIGVLLKEKGNVYVLHATPDGTQVNAIRYDDFKTFISLSKVSEYKIIRYKDLTNANRQKLKIEFEKLKNKQAKFDFEFNTIEHEKLYCSELVWLLYSNSGLLKSNVFDLNKPIYPAYFYESKYFSEKGHLK